ncbi:MAG: circularly permuted type 2 ATP-grasp protein [Acidobacteriia bacterium]|nr:circularly permuted type 2 ATP-grasp protein [Terriglobia bacterium]
MQGPNPPGSAETIDVTQTRAFANKYGLDSPFPDEMMGPDRVLRPHWQQFVSMLDALRPEEIRQRRDLARRLIHQNGVTHNVYGDPQGLDRPWSLDFIPLLIPADQWEVVCEGLIQRAVLLDRLLADLYGPAETVYSGILPPELLWANPGFLRSCHGIRLPKNRWIHLYAADLARTEDGRYEVLSDRTQAPSGAGYSLENRIVLSRALPSVFRQCNVQRLAPFFVSLRETLAEMAPANHENPRIVLLTPGPYNETYFEHSFLARYLGYALVQGNDLTVRDTIVYMKTLGGLQRVDVILRRVDDNFCDPLELYPDSYLGVPGLLQAVRRGNVSVANAIGCGVLQAPGFLPFLPGLCRFLLGEDLKLPSVRTWWCGHGDILEYVVQHLQEMVIKSAYPTQGEDPVFGQTLTQEELMALERKIRARPAKYVAQKQVMSCTTPALIGDHAEPRRFVVRSYLAAYGDSYTVMNGALTRITQSNDSLVVSLQKGGRSKDTWILSDGPVSPVTLLPSSSQPIAISRGGSDLPSRLAEDLFWLGRYAERTDSQARLARGVLTRMFDQSGIENAQAIETLASACRPKPLLSHGVELEREFIDLMLGDAKGEDLRGTVSNVHRLARVLRDTVSNDAWRILHELYRTLSGFKIGQTLTSAGVLELLDNLIVTIAAFVGLASDSMTRGQAWRFLDMGRRIERVSFISRFLKDTLVASAGDPVLLEAILDIGDSSLTYRRRYLTHLETHAIADLLLADETNPRSVAFQLSLIDQHLAALPRDISHPDRNYDQRVLIKMRTSIQLADFVELCSLPGDGGREKFDALLSAMLLQIDELSEDIAQLYFSHAVVSREIAGPHEERES